MHQAAVDHLSQGGSVGLNDRRRVVDLHFLIQDAYLQGEIDAGGLFHVQANIGQHGSAKAGLLDGHPVVAGRQQRDGEVAVIIGYGVANGIGGDVVHDHQRFGDDTAARVGYRAGDGARRVVCQDGEDERTPE